MIRKLFFFMCLALLSLSCKQEESLEYSDIYEAITQNTGQGIEWHGEEMNLEAKDALQIISNGTCSGLGCGDALFIENQSSQKVKVIIQAPFQIEAFSSHLATSYEIEPKSRVPIGCSKLCVEEESYEFERRIVSAEYMK